MKSKKLPSLIILMILTLITTLFWISFGIYNAFSDTPSPVVPSEITSKLDPKIDIETLNGMEGRIYYQQ